MKGIIGDSISAHLVMFFFSVVMQLPTAKTHPIFFVAIGVCYVLIIFHSAIRIANFEMSDKGKVLSKLESNEYERVDIHWYRKELENERLD